ncbi:MAG TPA: phosphoenolpyruvate--protein phosphotransferase [Vicinamibacterales bacterium]|jgi:phosphoenolpyruvate-protein phosphotransferase (PTS system enzyme I)|nr:phosphoenolpyruvate--protein phosphotransferase [Vicinamibacterales bacterium]
MERLKGIGVSPGVAVGPALVAIQRTQVIRFPIAIDRVARELSALDRARQRSREQLEQIRLRIAELKGADLASIFDAQLLMLDDPALVGRAAAVVRDERVNAEWAVQRALDELSAVFDNIDDRYLHERKGDVHDVAGRLRLNLREERGGPRDRLQDLDTPCVLIADELTPSVVAQLDWTRIRGFATDAGGRTYHTAILARSLGVPAVVGLHDVSRRLPSGASVILDGESGEVVIDPSPDLYQDAELASRRNRVHLSVTHSEGPLETADGIRVVLAANIERSDDVATALDAGAEGIGLYRSEFMLVGGPPDMAAEDEQYHVYRQLVEGMAPLPVTVRTFDIDERQLARPLVDAALDARWFPDQPRSGHGGLRGIRFGLAQPAIFKTQLRALLRAATHGQVRVMFPFVSSLQEVRAARALLEEARAELAARGIDTPALPVGIMIEVPSAAFTASLLAREVDFFTIGTNDLIQYTLAVDRTDERVSDRYQPLHPAVLRLLRQVRRAAVREAIPVSLCGEMASDPLLLRLLIGCGLTEFSMTPGALSVARRVVRETNVGQMARLAARVLTLGTVEEIEQFLNDAFASPAGVTR